MAMDKSKFTLVQIVALDETGVTFVKNRVEMKLSWGELNYLKRAFR